MNNKVTNTKSLLALAAELSDTLREELSKDVVRLGRETLELLKTAEHSADGSLVVFLQQIKQQQHSNCEANEKLYGSLQVLLDRFDYSKVRPVFDQLSVILKNTGESLNSGAMTGEPPALNDYKDILIYIARQLEVHQPDQNLMAETTNLMTDIDASISVCEYYIAATQISAIFNLETECKLYRTFLQRPSVTKTILNDALIVARTIGKEMIDHAVPVMSFFEAYLEITKPHAARERENMEDATTVYNRVFGLKDDLAILLANIHVTSLLAESAARLLQDKESDIAEKAEYVLQMMQIIQKEITQNSA